MSETKPDHSQPAPHLAISCYPLSNTFRKGLQERLGDDIHFVTAAQLRALSPLGIAKELLRQPARTVWVVSDGEGGELFQSILEGLATITKARHIRTIGSDYRIGRRWRVQGILGLVPFAWACLRGFLTTRSCAGEVRKLLAEEPQTYPLGRDNRILYLKTNLMLGVKAGGSVGHVAGVINEWVARGYQVDFVGAERPIGVHSSVNVAPVPLPSHFGAPVDVNHFRYHRLVAPTANRLILAKPYSFIYQRMSLNNFAGVLLSRSAKIPLVLEYNGSEAWVAKNWGIPLRFHDLSVSVEDLNLRHAQVVVTVSEILRDELKERGVPASKIVCYPNGVAPDRFNPESIGAERRKQIRQALRMDERTLVIGFLGTFGIWHGAEVMADALLRIEEETPGYLNRFDCRACFIGDGMRLGEVKRRFTEANQSNLAVFTGLIEQHEAPAYLAACDVVICPTIPNCDGSRFFGSPTKIFEYMAMARCIIASDLEQVGQVLRPGIEDPAYPAGPPGESDAACSVLVKPGDITALARAIRFTIENPEWRVGLGTNARKSVLAHYTWQHHVSAIAEALEKR